MNPIATVEISLWEWERPLARLFTVQSAGGIRGRCSRNNGVAYSCKQRHQLRKPTRNWFGLHILIRSTLKPFRRDYVDIWKRYPLLESVVRRRLFGYSGARPTSARNRHDRSRLPAGEHQSD